MRVLGDFDLAEEIVQDALLVALERWPRDGIPSNPGAWLLTVARHRALDQLRRGARYREKLMQLEVCIDSAGEPDDRLRLIFTCCHPALGRDAQIALTLRTVCGLSVGEIARAFLTSEPAIARRLVRARAKIRDARIPYRVPAADELEDRLAEVLAVLYLMFNEGYLASASDGAERRELAQDAAWLARLVVRLLPAEPEPLGLLALMQLHLARASARFDADGDIVVLEHQDRTRWDRDTINSALGLLDQAAQRQRPGPYQVQAAIVACHAQATSWTTTDWLQIVALYDVLLRHAPSPVIRLNRAVALAHVATPGLALEAVETLAAPLDAYALYHAIRADFLHETGQPQAASLALHRALTLTTNPAEQRLLQRRLAELQARGPEV